MYPWYDYNNREVDIVTMRLTFPDELSKMKRVNVVSKEMMIIHPINVV